MKALNKSINYYLLATCTCLSYLGLQSQTSAQVSTEPVVSNKIKQTPLQAPFELKQDETSDSKPVLEYTSRAELIRKLKRRIASSPNPESLASNQDTSSP